MYIHIYVRTNLYNAIVQKQVWQCNDMSVQFQEDKNNREEEK